MKEIKRVYLKAYCSMNLGDDLFLRIICDRYPKAEFCVIALPIFSRALRGIKNLKVLSGVSLIAYLLRKLKVGFGFFQVAQKRIGARCDAVVYITGSFLSQGGKWENTLNGLQGFINSNANSYIIGCNFGPYRDEEFLNRSKAIISQLTDICFRDKYSFELFADLKNVRYAPDVVFSLSIKKFEHLPIKKQVLISVIDLNRFQSKKQYTNTYEDKLIDIINDLARRGYSTKLMAFCQAEHDDKVINRILKSGKLTNIQLVTSYIYQGNIDEAISQIAESACVIATRFHAMILGLLFKKTVYPVCYSDKMRNVLNDMAFTGSSVDVQKVALIDTDSVAKYLIHSIPIDIQSEIEDSIEQFCKLDEYIGVQLEKIK